ncbi:MAG: carboxylating nicotinate-nucleotide diphosphorylase [Myxococcales bacterium]|nr:carboxylating nicotinate-nucleotide diphosphorylase [Myxococcales bacterium]
MDAGLDPTGLQRLLLLAIEEDLGSGDITGIATIDPQWLGEAEIRAKQPLVAAGLEILAPFWDLIDPEVKIETPATDGQRLVVGDRLAIVRGRVRSLLAGERICLNLLCHLCGVATLTAAYVEQVGPHRARILDTRKTNPGMRRLEKAAVRAGGGHNHRFGLYDQILIKDNHVDACGGVTAAIRKARLEFPQAPLEIEVRNEEELREALAEQAPVILLDNMDLDRIRRCVEIAAGRAELEVSGGVTLDRIAALAATGIDRISVGALTHSVPAADLHMKLTPNRA